FDSTRLRAEPVTMPTRLFRNLQATSLGAHRYPLTLIELHIRRGGGIGVLLRSLHVRVRLRRSGCGRGFIGLALQGSSQCCSGCRGGGLVFVSHCLDSLGEVIDADVFFLPLVEGLETLALTDQRGFICQAGFLCLLGQIVPALDLTVAAFITTRRTVAGISLAGAVLTTVTELLFPERLAVFQEL